MDKESSIITEEKPKKYRPQTFEPGNNANPDGRPKGSLNEVTKFKAAIEAFEKEQNKDIYKFILEKAGRYPQILIAIFKALIPQQTDIDMKTEGTIIIKFKDND